MQGECRHGESSFFNQFHKEQAYCLNPIPFSHCFTISKNCTITQDALRNITILTVRGRIDNSINGGWTCYHGTNVDKAVVNVTVLREGQYGFIAFGFTVEFPVAYLFLTVPGIKCRQLVTKDRNSDTSQLTTISNVETEQKNISDEELQQQHLMAQQNRIV